MALQSSGTISIKNVQDEFSPTGGTGGAGIKFSEYYRNGSIINSDLVGGSIPNGSAGTQISLSNFHGAKDYKQVTISGEEANVSLRAKAEAAGFDGTNPVRVFIASGSKFFSTNRAFGARTGTWPSEVKFTNDGLILGHGGGGGDGGGLGAGGRTDAQGGTPALRLEQNITQWYNRHGSVAGGGGGGASGSSPGYGESGENVISGGGGGAGGGYGGRGTSSTERTGRAGGGGINLAGAEGTNVGGSSTGPSNDVSGRGGGAGGAGGGHDVRRNDKREIIDSSGGGGGGGGRIWGGEGGTARTGGGHGGSGTNAGGDRREAGGDGSGAPCAGGGGGWGNSGGSSDSYSGGGGGLAINLNGKSISSRTGERYHGGVS